MVGFRTRAVRTVWAHALSVSFQFPVCSFSEGRGAGSGYFGSGSTLAKGRGEGMKSKDSRGQISGVRIQKSGVELLGELGGA